jgi:ATP-binding cassette subfamily B protein
MKLFCPEVVQTSAMDCGPASLKCLLEGFGIAASYGRLREACQTDVDGTSIDTLEEIAAQMGLDAQQMMLPVDHLLLPDAAALPALVVVRLPNGFTHFVVAWRRHAGMVQLMDPATGRRWMRQRRFLRDLYVHAMPVPAIQWREWAESSEFIKPLSVRLHRIRAPSSLIDSAIADPTWRGLATLDAAIRMTSDLVAAGALTAGRESRTVCEQLLRRASDEPSHVAARYWSASPTVAAADGTEQVMIRGAVLVRVAGVKPTERHSLPPDLRAALEEEPPRPGRALWSMLREDGLTVPLLLACALAFATAGTLLEAVLFRGMFHVGRHLGLMHQRLSALAALVLFFGGLLLLELPVVSAVVAVGRRLETRLRIAFLRKIPRLADRYFASRPNSDMAERSHVAHSLRTLPQLGLHIAFASMELIATTVGLVWLDRRHAAIAVAAGLLGVMVPLVLLPPVLERDMRLQSHAGALMRFYLDALLGLVAVRAHGAERSLRREHEALLVEWTKTSRALVGAAVMVETVQAVSGLLLAGWLLIANLEGAADPGGALLLAFWALNLPIIGQDIALAVRQYPLLRNRTLRLFEPLGARDDGTLSSPAPATAARPEGVAISLANVSVRISGHRVLEEISLDIAAGAHVAIVGPSGAGKSSLVGLLLGWHSIEGGTLVVDGESLDPVRLATLRRETAWIDPAVQLWNRSLIDNVRYGADLGGASDDVLEAAQLHGFLGQLPESLQTPLGENGGLVSGGEGQRVRFGRALMRRNARLVILDEAFRGLDRERRHALYQRARAWWPRATILCVTHDVDETRDFPRVLVIEGGRVVEDGTPSELAAQPSRYRALIVADAEVRGTLWRKAGFRRVILAEGRLRPSEGE